MINDHISQRKKNEIGRYSLVTYEAMKWQKRLQYYCIDYYCANGC